MVALREAGKKGRYTRVGVGVRVFMFWVPGSLAGARQKEERCVRERHTQRTKGTLLNAGGGGPAPPGCFSWQSCGATLGVPGPAR